MPGCEIVLRFAHVKEICGVSATCGFRGEQPTGSKVEKLSDVFVRLGGILWLAASPEELEGPCQGQALCHWIEGGKGRTLLSGWRNMLVITRRTLGRNPFRGAVLVCGGQGLVGRILA